MALDVCLSAKVASTLGAAAWKGIKKCASDSNEASRCLAQLGVASATTALSGGVSVGATAASLKAGAAIGNLAQAGKISASTADVLLKLTRGTASATAGVSDFMLNQLPTDPASWAKLSPADLNVLKADLPNLRRALKDDPGALRELDMIQGKVDEHLSRYTTPELRQLDAASQELLKNISPRAGQMFKETEQFSLAQGTFKYKDGSSRTVDYRFESISDRDGKGPLRYYTEEEKARSMYRYSSEQGTLVNARTGEAVQKGETYIYIVDRDGNLVLGGYRENHSQIARGESIAAAGLVRIDAKGQLVFDNNSGHYMPNARQNERNLRRVLERDGGRVQNVRMVMQDALVKPRAPGT